jgi:hypothetical protein
MTMNARSPRRSAIAAVAAGAMVLSIVPVHAQGFFEFFFQGQARPYAQPAPAYQPDPAYSPERARAARELRRLQGDKTRYARLPKAAAVAPEKVAPKPVQRGAILDTPGAMKAILNDSTLRPGDIVMFPSGPKVFVGGGSSKGAHRMSSFESVGDSRLVSKGTRASLAALAGPGAAKRTTTADAKVRLRGPEAKVEALAARSEGPRVVYRDTLGSR